MLSLPTPSGFCRSSSKFYLALTAIVLIFAILRYPFLEVPLQRDEGEYATMGLGILHGIPPYLEAYTMKLPGAAFLYAVIFWFLGPSTHSIHLTLLLVNAANMLLVAFLGRRWIGATGSLFAAAAYGTLSIGVGTLGLWLSAEHFSVLFLLSGACMMPSSLGKHASIRLLLGSLFLGTSILMKQHAAFPAIVWLVVLGRMALRGQGQIESIVCPGSISKHLPLIFGAVLAFFLPLLLTGGVMFFQGVFTSFWFWTFQYSIYYVSAVPPWLGWRYLQSGGSQVFPDGPLLWLLALAGIGILLWEPSLHSRSTNKEKRKEALLQLLPVTVAGIAAVSVGFFFRRNYFILLAPFAALLAGIAWETFWKFTRSLKYLGNILGVAVLIVSFGVLWEPLFLGWQKNPTAICRLVYGSNPFPEAVIVAKYLRQHTQSHEKIAILGSEPEIYFLADRSPAMPYIYVYEMMKPHPFAKKMQQEAIHCIKTSRPSWMIVVNILTSWESLLDSKSELTFKDSLNSYLYQHYSLEGLVDLVSPNKTVFCWGDDARSYHPKSPRTLLIFMRKDYATVMFDPQRRSKSLSRGIH